VTKPFRFGVQMGGAPDAATFRELAHKIESLGYTTLYAPDHFIDTQLAPMVALAVAAEATTTLRVSALVLGNDYKHPAVTAKEIATLDLLSDGRVDLGLGAGWMQSDYDALGLRYDSARVRIERLEEAIAVIKGAWSGKEFSYQGKHYEITSYTGLPKPVQQPHPPVLIGGGGPKLLRLAGREADVVGINPNLRAGRVTNDASRDSVASMVEKKLGWVREGAGERFDEIELQIRYFFASVTDDRRGLAEQVAPAFDLTPEEALGTSVALFGTVDQICDELLERRERWGVSNVVLGETEVESFAPIVHRLAGQ
jgi:probable F420-dependent oxidoreductase